MLGNSLAAQWLGLCASTAEVMGLVSGQGYKINDAQPKKKKLFCLLVYWLLSLPSIKCQLHESRDLSTASRTVPGTEVASQCLKNTSGLSVQTFSKHLLSLERLIHLLDIRSNIGIFEVSFHVPNVFPFSHYTFSVPRVACPVIGFSDSCWWSVFCTNSRVYLKFLKHCPESWRRDSMGLGQGQPQEVCSLSESHYVA